MPADGLDRTDALAEALRNADALVAMASRPMAEAMIGLIQDGFRSETDPYGTPWKPKKAADGRKTLSGPTSRLKTGWHEEHASKDGFQVAPAVDYAAPHQKPKRHPVTGRLKRPRRMMVPDEKLGMPESWSDELAEAAEEAVKAAVVGSWSADFSLFRKFSGGGGGGRRGMNPVERLRRRLALISRLKQQVKRKAGSGLSGG